MIDVLWHGRGGQGAFTAAKLLGAAYAVRGSYSIAFPTFGKKSFSSKSYKIRQL